MVAHTLHFKPILTPIEKKIVGGTPIPFGVLASKTWPSCGACKNLGRSTLQRLKYGFPKKSIWWVNISRENAVESGPKFTGLFPSNA